MHNPTAEILFPHSLIASLRDLRGPVWARLVDRATAVEESHPESLAFILMMIDLGECLPCNSKSYKFLQGCKVCSARTVRCFKGSDEELVALFEASLQRIKEKLPAYTCFFESAHTYSVGAEITVE